MLEESLRSKDGEQVILLKMERDIFTTFENFVKKFNLEYCLSFPSTPAPPSLCQYPGEMLKTKKTELASIILCRVLNRVGQIVMALK